MFISNDECDMLLLGSDDTEVKASFSAYDKHSTTKKARHVADASRSMIEIKENNAAITWIKYCEIVINNNFNEIKLARTVADWYLELHASKSLQFRRSGNHTL